MKINISNPIIIFVFVLFVILSSSCKQDLGIDSQQLENDNLATYIKSHAIKVQPSADGLYFIPLSSGATNGLSITKSTDCILFDYAALNINDHVYDSSIPVIAAINKDSFPLLKYGGPRIIQMNVYQSPYGLVEGFGKMKEGDSAEFIIPSTLWNNDFNTRIYLVKLKKVIPDIYAYEKDLIKNFLDTCKANANPKLEPKDSTTTPENVTGVYYIETLKGDGSNNPIVGDSVDISYKAKTINGSYFDSALHLKTLIGTQHFIPGFEAGVKHMKSGGKAIIIVPFRQGYGSITVTDPNTGQIIIQSWSTLVFEVTLNIIKKN